MRIECSVRELVEFVLRSGDIDNRFGGFDRAQEGARIHRKLQKEAGEGYQAEVTFTHETEIDAIVFKLSGRADGIFEENGDIYIDEIKTITGSLAQLTEDRYPVHWAQAKCYAYFYACQKNLDFIRVRLTYYHMASGSCHYFKKEFSRIELQKFYTALLKQYAVFARLKTDWCAARNAAIREMTFPYLAYRRGQREMALAVYHAIQKSQHLFLNAPTGIGKTLSTLFPALKALGEGYAEKIFYLTAKTSTRGEAEKNLTLLESAARPCRRVTLTAKDKICFLEQRSCNPDDCPYARGYYDKINPVLLTTLQKECVFTRERIETLAQEHELCPFELSLDLSEWCDVIIGDYNYLYDPQAALMRYFEDSQGKDYIFLVDESHNLADRSRAMYSAEVTKSAYLKLKKSLGKTETKLGKALKEINEAFLTIKKSGGDQSTTWFREAAYTALAEKLLYFCYACESWVRKNPGSIHTEAVLDCYFTTRSYLKIAELYDSHFVTKVQIVKNDVIVRQICLDASAFIQMKNQAGRSVIYFSATLTPLPYFTALYGENDAVPCYTLPSPFDPCRLGILMADTISTRYADRAKTLDCVAAMIAAFTQTKPGNYLVYFPSYAYMEAVYDVYIQMADAAPLRQTAAMDEAERQAFINAFHQTEEPVTGFCVLGGIYGEGIDLKGEALIGTVIVGVGLPKLTEERHYMRAYYDHQKKGTGFAYAYQYPGMNKVLQAMGRVIRDEKDRGMILLIDSRFATETYRKLMPAHLSHYVKVSDAAAVQTACADFWKE